MPYSRDKACVNAQSGGSAQLRGHGPLLVERSVHSMLPERRRMENLIEESSSVVNIEDEKGLDWNEMLAVR
jgi:hypothetical protein